MTVSASVAFPIYADSPDHAKWHTSMRSARLALKEGIDAANDDDCWNYLAFFVTFSGFSKAAVDLGYDKCSLISDLLVGGDGHYADYNLLFSDEGVSQGFNLSAYTKGCPELGAAYSRTEINLILMRWFEWADSASLSEISTAVASAKNISNTVGLLSTPAEALSHPLPILHGPRCPGWYNQGWEHQGTAREALDMAWGQLGPKASSKQVIAWIGIHFEKNWTEMTLRAEMSRKVRPREGVRTGRGQYSGKPADIAKAMLADFSAIVAEMDRKSENA